MIAVKKDHRGKGIGKQLVRLFLDHIKKNKALEVYLETEVTNLAAIKLYESIFTLNKLNKVLVSYERKK